MNVSDIDKLIESLQNEITELKLKKKELYYLTPLQRAAMALHSKFCRANHVDMCGWDYEIGSADCWNQSAHRYWLENAQVLFDKLVGMDKVLVLRVLEALP